MRGYCIRFRCRYKWKLRPQYKEVGMPTEAAIFVCTARCWPAPQRGNNTQHPPPPHSPQDAPPASCFPRSPPFAFGHGLPEICTARNSLCHLFHDFYARGSWHYKTRQDDIVDFLDYQIPLTQPGAVRFQNYLKINQHNQFENCGSDRFLRFGGFYSVCITTIFLVKSRLSYILCIYRYTISYTQSH